MFLNIVTSFGRHCEEKNLTLVHTEKRMSCVFSCMCLFKMAWYHINTTYNTTVNIKLLCIFVNHKREEKAEFPPFDPIIKSVNVDYAKHAKDVNCTLQSFHSGTYFEKKSIYRHSERQLRQDHTQVWLSIFVFKPELIFMWVEQESLIN